MKTGIITFLLIGLSLKGYCNFANYFEIKFNQQSIYNSVNSTDHTLKMELDSLTDRDLFEIKYHECGMAAKNDYELHIKVENTAIDLTFINDAPEFILNMGWFTQFKNKKASIYLYHTKYTGNAKQELIYKIVDLLIS